jgi:hypothetical protein
MNRSMNHQLIRIACCLLITIAGTLAARADDATVTSAAINTAPTIIATTNASTNAVDTGAASTNDASAIPATTNTAPTTTATTNASTNAVDTGTASTNDVSAISTATNTSPAITTTTNASTNVVETAATSTNSTATISATTNTTPTVTTTPNVVETEAASSIPTAPPPAVAYQPFSLAAEAGTTGLGGTAGWRFADHFGLEGGMDYFSFTLNRSISDIPYSGHLRLMSERAGLNLYPWKDHSFHVSLGAYFNQNRLSGTATSDGTLTVNGAVVPAGDSVKLVYKQQPVDPYVSIGGNVYFDKARHFSIGTELGAFYLGNPRVSVSTTPAGVVPLSNLSSYQQRAQHDLKKLPVWPVLKISFCYSF